MPSRDQSVPFSLIDRDIEDLNRKISNLDKERAGLESARAALVRLKGAASASNGKRPPEKGTEKASAHAPDNTLSQTTLGLAQFRARRASVSAGTTKAMQWIAANPGRHFLEVATALQAEGFAAQAKDPRKSILTMLSHLVENGRVRRDDEDKLTAIMG